LQLQISGYDPLLIWLILPLTNLQSAFLCLSDLPEELQNSVQVVLEQLGPLIADALIYNISGNAARSELDKICDPLKKLVVRHMAAKAWLRNALFSESFTSGKVSENDKNVFFQKIMK